VWQHIHKENKGHRYKRSTYGRTRKNRKGYVITQTSMDDYDEDDDDNNVFT
jgi:hypothetical protein